MSDGDLLAGETGKLFAIGDVHGCSAELRELLEMLPLSSDATVVFVGDYVDRGGDSRGVIETILELSQRCNVETLMGNHEAMFLDFLEAPWSVRAGMFIYNGGSSTLASYADDRGRYTIPDEHIAFLRSLKLTFETERYFFVHAGVPDIPLADLDLSRHRDDLLWTRKFLKSNYSWDKRIIHGHTARPQVEMHPHRINVDTGCVYNGRLTAVELPSQRIFSVRRKQIDVPRFLRDAESRRAAVRFTGTIPVEIHIGAKVDRFQTVNYSEIGMYLRAVSVSSPLEVKQRVEGTIGPAGPTQLEFKGEIVRVEDRADGRYYGVKVFRPAKDLADDSAAAPAEEASTGD